MSALGLSHIVSEVNNFETSLAKLSNLGFKVDYRIEQNVEIKKLYIFEINYLFIIICYHNSSNTSCKNKQKRLR